MIKQTTLKERPAFEFLASEYNFTYEQISKIEQQFHELFDDKIGDIGCIALVKLLDLVREEERLVAQIYNSGHTIDEAVRVKPRR